ncbi:O-antigen ligase family protein [Mesorhizobium sp. M3A.F.Ca.ET.080.04.2.1]|uniref:O-antigen ligase family protein n=1 Tax=Mesorhizobium sp. M3A.F.Ca.ET.080.04.2.1 TaxID=2493676 RepID=UPI000F74FF73|nr:O-antigen ligase [Mesorhizobium sp. M3A.F.Ca.ET.080.04.2.1]AZO09171.1 O-antigen ligase family protein [Mesorhizobium sp. M3A.F.Ca.ET.080.04.2.1]RWF18044.1 MAG: O-antigen ligase family protein [Mesorhizobium sp.]
MNALSSLRRHFTPAQINIYFSIGCFFSPPVLGSAVSFVFHGGALWSVMLLALKRRRFNIDRPMLAMTIAIYAYCAAVVLASIVNGTLEADFRFFLPLVTLMFFPISYSTWSITDKTTLARIAVLASAAACIGALALAIVQYYGIGIRAEGGAGNAIVFATVTCLAVATSLAGPLSGIERRNWKRLAVAALAGTVAILYSGSRIIWLALLLAVIAVVLINRGRLGGPKLRRLAMIAGAAGVAVAAIGFPVFMDRADFLFSDWTALATKGDHSTALGLRVAMWQIGAEAFRNAPIFGHGITASRELMKQGFHDQFAMEQGFNHFHNGFLTALVEAGLLGAIALAAIFVVAAWNAARVLRASAEATERLGATMVIVTVITYLVGGLTGILLGHDILDATLMVFLVSGTYLACGRTVSPTGKSAPAVAPSAGQLR